MKNIHDPQYWRDRAEEARNIADGFDDPRARAQMLEVAAGYERLAKMVEEADAKKPPRGEYHT